MLKTTTSIINASQITGVLPVLNGGTGVTTKTGTGSVVLSAAPTLSGDVSLSTGNIVPATAAKGINFTANTPAAGMTSQLLNWYEDGTWTPVVKGTGTAGTYELGATTVCTYTRTGRSVTLNAYIVFAGTITGGGTGELSVTGLPFTKRANSAAWGVTAFNGITYSAGKTVTVYFGTTSTSSSILFWESASGSNVTLTPITAVAAEKLIGFNITYEV
jgi:hypothetical protein